MRDQSRPNLLDATDLDQALRCTAGISPDTRGSTGSRHRNLDIRGFPPDQYLGGLKLFGRMLAVDTMARIRRAHFVDNTSTEQITREFGLARNTVGRVLRSGETAFAYAREGQPRPRLGVWTAAQTALPDLRRGFEELAAGMDRRRSERRLTLTVALTFADRWLLPRLDGFRQFHPRCDPQIDTSTRRLDFAVEPVDVGIRFGSGSWPAVTTTCLTCVRVFPLCGPDLMTGCPPLRHPEDLRHHRLIHDTSMAATPGFPGWGEWFAAAGSSVGDSAGGVRGNDPVAAYRMAISGSGVAMGRTTLVERDLAEDRPVRPFGRDPECALGYRVVRRPQAGRDPMIAAWCDWLLREVG